MASPERSEGGPVAFSTGGTDGTGSPGGRGAIPAPILNDTNGEMHTEPLLTLIFEPAGDSI